MPGGTHMNLGLGSEKVKTREAFQSSHFVLVFRSRFEPSPGTSTFSDTKSCFGQDDTCSRMPP